MGCFSLVWLEQLAIWVVIVVAIILVVRLLIPLIATTLGTPWQAWAVFIGKLLNIVIGAVIIIALIVLVFDLLFCVVGIPRLR